VLEAGLISALQRVEHYEIAAYGSARAYAEKLGRRDDANLLTASLEEEGQADRLLTQIADRHLNFEALVS
jgi:ferritin-like metal-binding protein YciE